MKMRNRCLVSVGIAALFASASMAQLTGWGTTFTGLYEVNLTTGNATLVGSTGSGLVTALAYDPNNDVLYGIDRDADTLLKINRSNGASATIGGLGIDTSAGGLAFDRNTGAMYYMDFNTASLYGINTASGLATLIGANGAGLTLLQGLAFDPNSNTLYASTSETNSLYTVNRSTGAVTLVGPFGVATSDHGLGFDDSTNTLYLANANIAPVNLFTVDTATGALTSVGPLTTSIQGFTVQQREIPVCDGSVLLSQPPNQANAAGSDRDPTGVNAETAEAVTFAQDVIVRTVRWWGVYFSSNTPQAGVDDFEMRIHEDAGGAPAASALATFHLWNTIRVGTGGSVLGITEFVYQADLPTPISFEAGKIYWLVISNNTPDDPDDSWWWEDGIGGDSVSAHDGPPIDGVWVPLTRDRALELCGVLYTLDCQADLNGDGIVDGADLAQLLAFWGVCPAPAPMQAPLEPRGDIFLNPTDVESGSLLGTK